MTPDVEASAQLADAAFGSDPGRWPLPAAATPHQRWLRAVAAGGQGRYGVALSELEAVVRDRTSGPLRSLAHSTRASFVRQLGGHRRARSADALAWSDSGADAEAAADALVGLAADALGIGRFAVSARLLERARDIEGAPRQRIRLAWVSAELAMAGGDGAGAVRHARDGVAAAADHESVRHAVKSDVVLAAALCSVGDLDGARHTADNALSATGKHGLIPLRWALSCLLADIGSGTHEAAQISRIRDLSADTVRRRGGVWSGR